MVAPDEHERRIKYLSNLRDIKSFLNVLTKTAPGPQQHTMMAEAFDIVSAAEKAMVHAIQVGQTQTGSLQPSTPPLPKTRAQVAKDQAAAKEEAQEAYVRQTLDATDTAVWKCKGMYPNISQRANYPGLTSHIYTSVMGGKSVRIFIMCRANGNIDMGYAADQHYQHHHMVAILADHAKDGFRAAEPLEVEPSPPTQQRRRVSRRQVVL